MLLFNYATAMCVLFSFPLPLLFSQLSSVSTLAVFFFFPFACSWCGHRQRRSQERSKSDKSRQRYDDSSIKGYSDGGFPEVPSVFFKSERYFFSCVVAEVLSFLFFFWLTMPLLLYVLICTLSCKNKKEHKRALLMLAIPVVCVYMCE